MEKRSRRLLPNGVQTPGSLDFRGCRHSAEGRARGHLRHSFYSMFLKILNSVTGNPVTLLFVALIATVFIFSLSRLIKDDARARSISRSAPTTLTSLGILGTFCGIFLGLLDFDVHNIDQSIPALLEGLKVAFFTSILGMSAAIFYKFLSGFFQTSLDSGGVGPEEIHSLLGKIYQAGVDGHNRTAMALDALRSTITDDGDLSLITQLQKLRIAQTDGQNAIKATLERGFEAQLIEFQKFAEKAAENNSKILIEALEAVIRDFNVKISEQFGENFKQLNHAVGDLLTWQGNYKDHIEKLTGKFEMALGGINDSRNALVEISEHASAIPETMQNLGKLLAGLQLQTENLESHLEAFHHLRTQAGEAFPIIEHNLMNLTEGVSRSVSVLETALTKTAKGFTLSADEAAKTVTAAASHLEVGMTAQKRSFQVLENGFRGLKDEASSTISSLSSNIEQVLSEESQRISDLSDAQSHAMQNAVARLQQNFSKAIDGATGSLGKQIEELDKQMQIEVERVVKKMGTSLLSITNKFVEDYTKVTETLEKFNEWYENH